MKADKDTLERRYLDSFKIAYPLFPIGKIRKGDPLLNEPDFVIENGDEKTGIELSRLYRDHGKNLYGVQPQKQLQERVVTEAQKIFEKVSDFRCRVFISFKERSKIDGTNVQILTDYLADIISQELNKHLPVVDFPVEIGSSCFFQHEEVFSYIYIDDLGSEWTRNNVNHVELLNPNILNDVVENKEKKYQNGNYSACSKVWLLLCMNYFDPATDQAVPDNFKSSIKASHFDKILIYKTVSNEIIQIYP